MVGSSGRSTVAPDWTRRASTSRARAVAQALDRREDLVAAMSGKVLLALILTLIAIVVVQLL